MGNKKTIATILIFILSAFSLLRTIYLLWNSYLPDFSVYYNSANALLEHANPYTLSSLFTQIIYPPIALYFVSPFLLFEFSVASKIWLIFSILLLLITLIVLYKRKPVSILHFSIFVLLVIFSFPFKFTLGMGQINFLILLLLSLFLVLENKNLKSLMLSLSVLIKIFPLLLVVVLIFKKKWREVFLTFIIITFSFLISLMAVGKDINYYYFDKVLSPLLKSPAGEVYYNQSISGFAARLGFFGVPVIVLKTFIFLSTIFILTKKRTSLNFSLITMLITILLINNFTWQHHLILLVLPYYYLISGKTGKLSLILVFVSYFLIASNIPNPDFYRGSLIGNLYLSHGFLGLLLLWFIFIMNNISAKVKAKNV